MEFISQQKTRPSSLEFDCYRAQFSGRNPERFMTFRKNVIFAVVDESARVLALEGTP
jgi:hypothetical protein